MKILQLNVEGFRSLKKVEWKPGDLNVVIGANASGKSNLLDVLGLFSEMTNGRLSQTFRDMGGIDNVLWNRRTDELRIEGTFLPSISNARIRSVYSIELHSLGMQNRYMIDKEVLQTLGKLPSEDRDTIHDVFHRSQDRATIYANDGRQITFQSNSFVEGEDLDAEESILAVVPRGFVANDLARFRFFTRNCTIFRAFRTELRSDIRTSTVAQRDLVLRGDGSNLPSVLHTLYTSSSDYETHVDDAMRCAFPDYDKLVFPPAALQKIDLAVKWKSLKDAEPAINLSDGTLRFLFIVAALSSPDPPTLIAIDEPETGLHPRMFGIIAEYAVEAARKTQVIFTTHSPEFLDAFSDTKPTTTVAQWVDGETRLAIPDPDRLAYWMKDYSLGEMFMSHDLENLVET